MSVGYPVMPAIETVLVAALRASAELEGTFGDRISTKLAEGAFDAGEVRPYLTLRRTGGVRVVERWLDGPQIDFGVWGAEGTEAAVEVAANLAESVVLALAGGYASAVITGVQPILGPRNVSDPETGWPRYIFEARVFAHPTE